MATSRRIAVVDWAKLVYAFVIVLVHANYLMPGAYDWRLVECFGGGYVAVEFFFIVSGFLMAKAASKTNIKSAHLGYETIQFIGRKILVILPIYVVAYMLDFILMQILNNASLYTAVKQFIYAIPYFLRYHMAGFEGIVDPIAPAWYISSMLLAMLLLYPMFKKFKDIFSCVIAPLLTLFLYGYISQTRGNISASSIWIGSIYVGNLRAIAGISLGCICWEISQKISNLKFSTLFKKILTVVEGACYILPIISMQLRAHTKLDFIIIFMFAVAITLSFSRQTYSSEITFAPSWVANFSLSIYLTHNEMNALVKVLFPQGGLWDRLPWMLLFSVIFAIICMIMGMTLRKFWVKRWPLWRSKLVIPETNCTNSR